LQESIFQKNRLEDELYVAGKQTEKKDKLIE
jgi:uncharacterized coiled-coil DUF342 family protein